MSRFTGKQYRGAMRDLRERKRQEAEERNERTLPERRRKYLDGDAGTRLIVDIFGGAA